MRNSILCLFLFLLTLTACQKSRSMLSGSKGSAQKSKPTGKYRSPTMFNAVNPFQGRAKARLIKSKKKRLKLFKQKHKQRGTYRKRKKPGRAFDMKRTLSRSRIKSSGKRIKSGGNNKSKKKNLFNTRKK